MIYRFLFFLIIFSSFGRTIAQDAVESAMVIQDTIPIKKTRIDPLSPSKAAFYSAVLPGLGQAYNKKYWKIPIVYGALGTGVYFYVRNTNEYNRYRDAYKSRLAGLTSDEFYDINNSGVIPGSPDVSDEALRDAQEFYQRNRDLSILITVGLYLLNIIDANVDAHLKQYNVNDDLTLHPVFQQYENNYTAGLGLALTYRF